MYHLAKKSGRVCKAKNQSVVFGETELGFGKEKRWGVRMRKGGNASTLFNV